MPINFNDLTNRVTFYTTDSGGFLPSDGEETKYYSCYAAIDNVWLKDIEMAKSNNTLNDVTVKIRETQGEYVITDEMTFTIDGRYYRDAKGNPKKFNIKSVQPDYQDHRFAIIIGEAVT
ncbi:head-tail adaptor protein [Salinicoccus carnicancri]|uniref:head-tail adaptor protein n=1 Tax=Salinicoccus carnicancri TaxID=558170 RepID=UPI0002F241F1|nr:head-tail adaptor protein [Salinicoccus carnicancri]